MSNEVVRYDNDFSQITLDGFNSVDLDLTMGIISKLKDMGTQTVTVSFADMKRLAHYQGHDNNRFFHELDEVTDKMMNLRIKFSDSNSFTKVNIFSMLQADKDEQILTAKVSEDFKYLFNELTTYTTFELEEFTHLKSKYAKSCYRQLKQWKSKGHWIVKKEDFIRLLDIPSSYSNTNINQRVLKPIKEELSPLFQDFTISPVTDKKKRGQPIIRYEFLWTPSPLDIKKNRSDLDEESSHEGKQTPVQKGVRQNAPEQTGYECPFCHQRLYKIYNKNGGETDYFYGHLNFKDKGACRKTFDTVSDIKGYSETPSRDNQNHKSGLFGKFKNPFKDF